MSKFEEMKDQLSNSFDNLNDALEVELRENFSIIDHQGQSFIVLNSNLENQTFTIRVNGIDTVESDFDDTKVFKIVDAKTVAFIPIDGRNGLLGFGDSCCDFVFFDDNDFCFVEFKLNATSLEERAIRKNRKKAIDQVTTPSPNSRTSIGWASQLILLLHRKHAELCNDIERPSTPRKLDFPSLDSPLEKSFLSFIP
jgi:hypothetical protein